MRIAQATEANLSDSWDGALIYKFREHLNGGQRARSLPPRAVRAISVAPAPAGIARRSRAASVMRAARLIALRVHGNSVVQAAARVTTENRV